MALDMTATAELQLRIQMLEAENDRLRADVKWQAAYIGQLLADAPNADAQDDNTNVVDWIKGYRDRHGCDPAIHTVQQRFSLSRTTAWRRIRASA